MLTLLHYINKSGVNIGMSIILYAVGDFDKLCATCDKHFGVDCSWD